MHVPPFQGGFFPSPDPGRCPGLVCMDPCGVWSDFASGLGHRPAKKRRSKVPLGDRSQKTIVVVNRIVNARKTRIAAALNQGQLFEQTSEPGGCSSAGCAHGWRAFVAPDRAALRIGAKPLGEYLDDIGQRIPQVLVKVLDNLDWSSFEQEYWGPGRAPYSPRLMAALVMYGLLKGVTSLRGLEELAQVDLG